MRTVPLTAVGRVDHALAESLARALARRRTLADVLSWAREQSPPRTVAEIVTQDEYTHDVLVALDAPHWLVFDTT